MSTTTMTTMNRTTATTMAAMTKTYNQLLATIWGGGNERKGQVGGVERRRWAEFLFEGDEDDVNSIDDCHDGADCGNDDGGRNDDDKDEHFDNAGVSGVKYNNNDGDGNGKDNNHDEVDGIGGDEDKSTINSNETMTV
jgi:hypothetical protein